MVGSGFLDARFSFSTLLQGGQCSTSLSENFNVVYLWHEPERPNECPFVKSRSNDLVLQLELIFSPPPLEAVRPILSVLSDGGNSIHIRGVWVHFTGRRGVSWLPVHFIL